jgi:hypothetical protein
MILGHLQSWASLVSQLFRTILRMRQSHTKSQIESRTCPTTPQICRIRNLLLGHCTPSPIGALLFKL